MLLSEIFDQLRYGELAQTIIGKTDPLPTSLYPSLITHINLGVQALYERFELWEKELTIEQHTGTSLYHLTWDYAFSNSSSSIAEANRYILDTSDPFNESELLRVLTVWSELGEEYNLNPLYLESGLETETDLVAYTPAQTILQLGYPVDKVSVIVTYLASPPNTTAAITTPLTTEINLPRVLLIPLLAFIADRYFINMTANNKEAIVYPKKYEIACQQVDRNSLTTHSTFQGVNRFRRGGWQ